MTYKKNKIIIFGTGEIASMAKFFFEEDGLKIDAFTVDDDYISDSKKENVPIIPFSSLKKEFNVNKYSMHVALSYSEQNKLRELKFNEVKNLGYHLENYISKKSYIDKNVIFGENCFILENQTIQKGVKIGNNVTMWSSNHIGHETKINSHSYLSSHVVVSGHCVIGQRCFLGVNSSISDFTEIGDDCFIGMSSSISRNLKPGSVAISKSTEIYDKDHKVSKILKKKYFKIK